MKRNNAPLPFLLPVAVMAISLCGCNAQKATPSPSPVTVTPANPGAANSRALTPEDQRYLNRYGRDSGGQKTR